MHNWLYEREDLDIKYVYLDFSIFVFYEIYDKIDYAWMIQKKWV